MSAGALEAASTSSAAMAAIDVRFTRRSVLAPPADGSLPHMPTTSSEGAALAPTAAAPVAPAGVPAEAVNVLPVDYASGHRATRFRWVVLALVFFAITINYIDRNVMGLVAPEVRERFGIDSRAYGYVTGAFALCYALGQAMSGRWL